MPFEKQEDPPEFRDDPPAFALEEVLLLRCGSADGEHFAGLKGFLAAIGRLGYSGAVVDRQVRRVCAGTDVVVNACISARKAVCQRDMKSG